MFVILRKAVAFSCVSCSHLFGVQAQLNFPAQHEFGISAGTYVYQGDLTPEKYGAFKSARLSIALFYNRILSPSFSARTNLAFGRIAASDANYGQPAYRQQRNLAFTAQTTELSELLVWNILANNYSDRHRLSPYLFAGAGLNFLNIKRDYSRFNVEYFASETATLNGLAADTLHALPNTIPIIPVGVGIRFALSSKWSIMAESSYRFVFTDYLDGFSQVANPGKNDHYMSYTAGLVYTLGRDNSLRCPVMKY